MLGAAVFAAAPARGGDAPGLASEVVGVAGVVYAALLVAWGARQAFLLATSRGVNRAKALVLGTTAVTWWGGIVWLDSDVVFTASNVLAHGVPYLALVHRYGRARFGGAPGALGRVFAPSGAALYVGLLVLVATFVLVNLAADILAGIADPRAVQR